jgi:hypothetical protein
VNSCIGAVTFSNISSWALWSDIPLMRRFIVKFNDKSRKMLPIAVLEKLKILIGKFTVLFRLYRTNRVSNCSLPLWPLRLPFTWLSPRISTLLSVVYMVFLPHTFYACFLSPPWKHILGYVTLLMFSLDICWFIIVGME